MTNVTAILSLLHEPPRRGSAERLFRGVPVLQWTLDRLDQCARVDHFAILCWDDQLPAVEALAGHERACVLAKRPRVLIPEVEAVAAAQRWADGWRGGLGSTCDFDRGFYGPWALEAAQQLQSDAVVLIDPASALVDASLVDGVIAHAAAHPDEEIAFAPAAPGLCGPLVRRPLLERLAGARAYPGRLMHYRPDQLSREPLATAACAPVPTTVARTRHRFALDSDRQVLRLSEATLPLNGQLIATDAEELVRRMNGVTPVEALPREVVIELNTRRATRPIFSPLSRAEIDRPPMTPELAQRIVTELAQADDVRVTIAGVGDPLLSPTLFELIDFAFGKGIRAFARGDGPAGRPE